jgi:hypothetical protein
MYKLLLQRTLLLCCDVVQRFFCVNATDYSRLYGLSCCCHARVRFSCSMWWVVGAGMAYRYSDWLQAERPRGRSSRPRKVKNFLFSTSSRQSLGSTQTPTRWVPDALFSGVKRPGREADHSPPASAEVKKMWFYTSTPPKRLHGVVLN